MLKKVAVVDVVDLSEVFENVHGLIVKNGQRCAIRNVCDDVHLHQSMVALTNPDGTQELGVKQRGGIVSTFAKRETDGLVVPAGTLDMDAVQACLNVYQQKLGL